MVFGNFFRPKHTSITRSYDRHDIAETAIPVALLRAAIGELPVSPPAESSQVRTIRVPNLGGVRVVFTWHPNPGSGPGQWRFTKAELAKVDNFSSHPHFEPVRERPAANIETGDEKPA